MDPVIELATVTVSYLWMWRELNPDAERLAVDTPLSAEVITKRIGSDMAMYSRMRDLTLRNADERVVTAPADGDKVSPFLDSTDMADLVRLLASERATGGDAVVGSYADRVRQQLNTMFHAKATRDDLASVVTRIAQRYVSDLQAILSVIPVIELNDEADAASGTGSRRNSAGAMSRE